MANITSTATPSSGVSLGDTAWMLTSTALVLFMTMPGLTLYYAGMVHQKNILATVLQVFSICSLITCSWMFWGYSLSCGPVQPNDLHTNIIFGLNLIFI